MLLISHDREFLNQLVGSIVEIRQGQLLRYRGNYDEYLVQREAQSEQLLAAYKNQQRDIQRLQEFADRFRAKASKASQAQAKLKQIERMDKIEAPVNEARKIKFQFPQPQRSGLRVITLKNIHHAYGNTVVYRGMNFEAERGQRIVLVGPNGAGKSTLLKLLAGVLPVQRRHARVGPEREGRLLRAVPRRDAEPRTHGAPGSARYAATRSPSNPPAPCSARSCFAATTCSSRSACSAAAKRAVWRWSNCCSIRRTCC